MNIKIKSTNKVLVTGATGFIGKNLCKLLLKDKYKVFCITKNIDAELLELGVTFYHENLFTFKKYNQLLIEIDYVVHLAGNPTFGDGHSYYRNNYELTIFLIKQCQKYALNLKKFIFISTIGAVDRHKNDKCHAPIDELTTPSPKSDYGKSKLMSEQALKNSNLCYTIIRPSLVIGEGMRPSSHFSYFSKLIAKKSFFSRIFWPGAFSVVHVNDLSRAIIFSFRNLQTDNETFFVAGDKTVIGSFLKRHVNHPIFPLNNFNLITKIFSHKLPFKLKCLLLPSLVATDEKLTNLGWKPTENIARTLNNLVENERSKININLALNGATLITGAASGLGRAFLDLLVKKRKHIILIDKNTRELNKLKKLHNNISTFDIDLSQNHSIDKFLKSDFFRANQIDEFYACAGVGFKDNFINLPFETHEKIFAINLNSRIKILRALLPNMIKNEFGRIVFVSSSTAFQPIPTMASYAASNAALLNFTEAIISEIKNPNIKIIIACPSGMDTNFQKSSNVTKLKKEKLMSPESVAKKILKKLEKNSGILIISLRSFLMSFAARILPRKIIVFIWNRLMVKYR